MKRIMLFALLAFCILNFGNAVAEESRGNAAVIGTGMMGGAMGPMLAKQGYTVTYGSRSPDRADVQELVARTAGNASAALPKDAVISADLVVLAIPWPAMETVAQNLGDLSGKLLLDVSNPMGPADDGYQELLVEPSSAELIQGWNPDAKVVKALNATGYFVVANPAEAGGPVSVPVASDHVAEKCTVMNIVARAGMQPMDAGPLRHAHLLEAAAILYMMPFSHRTLDEGFEFYFRPNSFWHDWSESLSNEERADWEELEPRAPGYQPCN